MPKSFIAAAVVTGLTLLTSCAGPAHKMSTAYSAADFAAYEGTGNANLNGQAFLRTKGGEVRTCAGSDVLLFPGTAYTREVMSALRSGAGSLDGLDTRWRDHARKAICGADGKFQFTGLPAGSWVVAVMVTWQVPMGSYMAPQGGELRQTVTLKSGQTTDAVLSDRDLNG